VVTASTSKDMTRGAANSCLECCPSILKTVGSEGSTKEVKERCEASLEVGCSKIGYNVVLNREGLKAKVDVWGV
jgi:hypothetical protein